MINYLLLGLLVALTNNGFLLVNIVLVLLTALITGFLSKRYKGLLTYLPIIGYFLFFCWSLHQLV